jgi:hypothetical protein
MLQRVLRIITHLLDLGPEELKLVKECIVLPPDRVDSGVETDAVVLLILVQLAELDLAVDV